MIAMLSAATWGWSEMLWATLISIVLVFVVLVLLVYIMRGFSVIFSNRKVKTPAMEQRMLVHDEEIAAIATALRMFRSELHDRESEVLTIMSIKRSYSPWNSKIHGLTQLPDRK